MTLKTKKCPLRPYLALYVQFSQGILFTKAMLTNYRICHDFNCYINKREIPKTCLTNHKGSISHHITLLVINSFGMGIHIHTHMHTYITDKSNFKKPVMCWLKASARTWFNNLLHTHACTYIHTHTYMYTYTLYEAIYIRMYLNSKF